MISEHLKTTHLEWHEILAHAVSRMDAAYLDDLNMHHDYLPQASQRFAAFSRPLRQTQYILLGESPYPRAASANGYAFWDAAVDTLWSDTGLSKAVNRATSLRNLIKMLLHARGDLINDFSQGAIAGLNHTHYHQTLDALFTTFLNRGFMLLNASLVYETNQVNYHARHWAPFMAALLEQLAYQRPDIQLILFGKIAEKIVGYERFDCVIAEHPYNISFITNPDVLAFFKPMDLLANQQATAS